MFPNIKAEQARNKMTNQQVADHLGINRRTYESKLKSGNFIVSEGRRLCELFGCDFYYLFSTDGAKAG